MNPLVGVYEEFESAVLSVNGLSIAERTANAVERPKILASLRESVEAMINTAHELMDLLERDLERSEQ